MEFSNNDRKFSCLKLKFYRCKSINVKKCVKLAFQFKIVNLKITSVDFLEKMQSERENIEMCKSSLE